MRRLANKCICYIAGSVTGKIGNHAIVTKYAVREDKANTKA